MISTLAAVFLVFVSCNSNDRWCEDTKYPVTTWEQCLASAKQMNDSKPFFSGAEQSKQYAFCVEG